MCIRDSIYTGELITAHTAYELGLCEYVAEAGKATEKALEIARIICSKGPLGTTTAKKCITYAQSHDLKDALNYENEMTSALFDTEDAKEGITAFLEKRKPEFKNR